MRHFGWWQTRLRRKKFIVTPMAAAMFTMTATEVRGVYVAHLTFTRSGNWGVELVARQPDGLSETARLTVVFVKRQLRRR